MFKYIHMYITIYIYFYRTYSLGNITVLFIIILNFDQRDISSKLSIL